MKVQDGEDIYLIQWLGDHRDSAEWQSKHYIRRTHPKQLIHIQNFDKQLARKCSQVRGSYFNTIKRNTKKRAASKEAQESNEQQSSIKANSTAESGQTIRKKGNMTLRHGSDQVISKVKTLLSKQKSSIAIPSSQFKISIYTAGKNQNHWAHRNTIMQIEEKLPGQQYRVRWDDGKTTQFNQDVLMEREAAKLCNFWEKKLGIWSSQKRKQ